MIEKYRKFFSLIHFVFRKNVKTRTKTGYRMIIFLDNVPFVSCATFFSFLPKKLEFTLTFTLSHSSRHCIASSAFIAVTICATHLQLLLSYFFFFIFQRVVLIFIITFLQCLLFIFFRCIY